MMQNFHFLSSYTPLVLLIIYLIYLYISPLTPMSDQDRISPYNINTISCRQLMRIKKNVNLGIIR